MLHVTRLAQNQDDPINSILQYGSVVGKDCCVVFSASGNPYLILCSRQCKGKVATNYLQGLRTMKIFQYKNLLPLKPSQTTRSDIQHCNHWKEKKYIRNIRNNFSSYVPGAFSDMVKYFCEWWWYKSDGTYILMGILNVLFLEIILSAALVS